MREFFAAVVLILGLANGQATKEDNTKHLVLPNPNLLRCKSSDCFTLWLGGTTEANAVFPKQTIIDMDQGCLYALRAIYDKSVSIEELRAAIDGHYGKWTVPGFENKSIKLWRVESEKFAIQLSTNSKWHEKRNLGDAGTKNVIYIAFQPPFREGAVACGTP